MAYVYLSRLMNNHVGQHIQMAKLACFFFFFLSFSSFLMITEILFYIQKSHLLKDNWGYGSKRPDNMEK